MPDDSLLGSDDGGETADQRSTPADPSSTGESENEGAKSSPDAGSDPQDASSQDGPNGDGGDEDFGERLLVLQRRRDKKDNQDTLPPAGEAVTFRSVTVTEIYVDQEIDSITTALAAIDWGDSDESIADKITETRRGDNYLSGVFWLTSDGSQNRLLGQYGRSSLPSGIDRIYGEYFVAGPSVVALVLTFVLASDDAKRLDAALRDDAESRLRRLGVGKFSIRTVKDVKKERFRSFRHQVTQRCLRWVKEKMPGTLSATASALGDAPGPPTCALVSLTVAKPFHTSAEYMALLGLGRPFLAERFVRHDFLFLVHLIDRAVDGWMMAAFNEADAVGSGWVPNLRAAPELFHQEISSLMVADGLNAALRSFEPQLRAIRADLNRLDIDEPAGTQVIGLRNRLLGLTREITTVCGDLTIFMNGALMVWADFSPLVRVRLTDDSSASVEITADSTRQELRAVIESLQAQEAELRELILVITSAVNETRTMKLNNRLGRLTWGLVFLTVALVFIGIVQLVVTARTGTAPQTPTPAASHPASPAPLPSARPSGSVSSTKSTGVQS